MKQTRWYGGTRLIGHGIELRVPTDLDTTTAETETPDAARQANLLLLDVGTRLAHSATVAMRASRASRLLGEPWRSVISAAAWLHDIGYAEPVAQTGFHPLDGARWLRDRGWPDEVCRLVAWHTDAEIEAAVRGLDSELIAEFAQPPPSVAAALSWADMTSSPTGELCTVDHRIDDILARYPAGSAVHTATAAARPSLCAAAAEVEAQLALDIAA